MGFGKNRSGDEHIGEKWKVRGCSVGKSFESMRKSHNGVLTN